MIDDFIWKSKIDSNLIFDNLIKSNFGFELIAPNVVKVENLKMTSQTLSSIIIPL